MSTPTLAGAGFAPTPFRVSALPISEKAMRLYGYLLFRSDAPSGSQPCDRPIEAKVSTEELTTYLKCQKRTLGLCFKELEQYGAILPQEKPGPRGPVHLLMDRMGNDVPAPSGAKTCATSGAETCATWRKNLRHSGQESRKILRPSPIREFEAEKEEYPPNPPMGGEPGGGGDLSSTRKTEDPGTEARSIDSRPSGDPEPELPTVAARVEAEVRGQASDAGLADDDARKLVAAAIRAVSDGAPEECVRKATAAAIKRWGQGPGGANSLIAVTLKKFSDALEDARQEAATPKLTEEEKVRKIVAALREADKDHEIQAADHKIANVIRSSAGEDIDFMLTCTPEELSYLAPAMSEQFGRYELWNWRDGVRILRSGDPERARGHFTPSKAEAERQKQAWEASDPGKAWSRWVGMVGEKEAKSPHWFKQLAREQTLAGNGPKYAKLTEMPDAEFAAAMKKLSGFCDYLVLEEVLGIKGEHWQEPTAPPPRAKPKTAPTPEGPSTLDMPALLAQPMAMAGVA